MKKIALLLAAAAGLALAQGYSDPYDYFLPATDAGTPDGGH